MRSTRAPPSLLSIGSVSLNPYLIKLYGEVMRFLVVARPRVTEGMTTAMVESSREIINSNIKNCVNDCVYTPLRAVAALVSSTATQEKDLPS